MKLMSSNKEVIQPIEWLRALAVVSVVLYHIDKNILPGGYLGVDIFLVVSGYLVGGALANKLHFTSSEMIYFLKKRFWRLQPALVFTLIISFYLSYLYGTPHEFTENVLNSAAAFSGVSNVYFWSNTSYFGGSSEFNYLLHTWSLSLEWQYYISFALLCFFWLKVFNRNISILILLILVAASFLVAVKLSTQSPSANFFLLPSRLWEFCFGTLIYNLRHLPNVSKKLLISSPLGFLLGLTLCFYSVVFIDEKNSLPSHLTIIPVLGTCICLFFVNFKVSPLLQKITYIPFLIGRSSYSIYLLHWPLCVAFAYSVKGHFVLQIIFVMFIFLAGYIIYKYIEIPFSKIRKHSSPVTITILLISFSTYLFIFSNEGFPDRFTKEKIDLIGFSNSYINKDRMYCLNLKERNDLLPININCKSSIAQKRVLMWGDSHLEPFRGPFNLNEELSGMMSIDFVGVGGCPPVPYLERLNMDKRCNDYSQSVLNYILSHHNEYDLIVIGARFTSYIKGNTSYLGPAEGGLDQYIYDIEYPSNLRNHSFSARFKHLLDRLGLLDIPIVLLGGIPEYGHQIPREMFRRSLHNGGDIIDITIPIDIVNERLSDMDLQLRKYSFELENVYFYDPKKVLCDENQCYASINKVPMYFDDDHLNYIGATRVAFNFMEFIESNGIW